MTAACAIVLLCLVLERCRRGFDFTDEGFYLNSISDPWLYAFGVSQFGLVYHPVFRLLSGDVVLLRQFNVLLTWGLTLALAWPWMHRRRDTLPLQGALAVSVAGASLLYLSLFWLPTPSYNSLTLQGLLIVGIGFTAARRAMVCPRHLAVGRQVLAAAFIGAGSGIVFLAKPTSAVLLAAGALPLALMTFRSRVLAISVSAAVAALLVIGAAYMLDGGVGGLIARYRAGFDYSAEFVRTTSIFKMLRLEKLNLTRTQQLVNFSVAIGSIMLLALPLLRAKVAALLFTVGGSIAALLGVVMLFLWPDWPSEVTQARNNSNFIVAMPMLAGLAMALVIGRQHLFRDHWTDIALSAFFVFCPYIYAFGTGNRVSIQALGAIVFWPIALTLLLRTITPEAMQIRLLSVIAVLISLLTVGLVGNRMTKPYAQNGPLHAQQVQTRIGPSGASELLLDERMAEYINSLRELAPAGLDGEVMLDLTGTHPGTVFALGAKAIVSPWMIGGQAGSNAAAARALAGVPCDLLARAWVLVSPTNPRSISISLLESHGLLISTKGLRAVRGPSNRNSFAQHLVAPQKDQQAVVAACKSRRESASPLVVRQGKR